MALVALVLPSSAHAAFPGANGKIAFVSNRDGNSEIYTVNPDGSGVQRLTTNPGNDISPEWSPDGTRIVFSRGPGFADGDITVMNADGSGQTVVGNGVDPSWSPDGGRIAFTRLGGRDCDAGEGLYTMNADGSDVTPLTCFAIGDHRDPAWAPDGQSIVFAADFLSYDIYRIESDGTDLSVVASTGDFEWQPDWSPDGSRIAFVSDREPSGSDYRIYTMNSDGSAQMMFTDPGPSDDVFHPSWSPDGTKIAYTNFNIPNRIYIRNVDRTNPTVLTDGSEPDWQPIPINSYPRPKGATPSRFSLVPAYLPCSSSNRTHGPPLAFASCNPPLKNSPHLTVPTPESNGAPVAFEGSLRTAVVVGNPMTPADEADVTLTVSGSDVRCDDSNPPATCGAPNIINGGSGIPDYTGELEAVLFLRITDKDNTPHPGGPGAATVEEFDLHFSVPCTGTASANAGSSCATTTSVDTLIPGAVKEGKRAIWELDRVHVRDGGADGDADTTGNRVFLRPGVFIP